MESSDHRVLAARFYNASWELLEFSDRDGDADAMLLTNAFASRAHWMEVGGVEQLIISDWMVSRAAAATGWAELSLFFALRAVTAAQAPEVSDWLVASCAEGLARAHAASGDLVARDEWVRRAEALVAAIGDEEDRAIIAAQLASLVG